MFSSGCNSFTADHSARALPGAALALVAAFFLVLGGSQAVGALENEVAGDHLLRLHDHQQLEDGRLVSDEVLIFRDGLTVLLRSVGLQTRIFRGEALTDEIRRLKGVLVDEGVDLQHGGCDLEGIPRVLGGNQGLRSRSSSLSWFGVRGRRARHLALGHGSSATGRFGQDCPASLQRVAATAFSYAQTVLSGPSATSDPDEHYPLSLLFAVRNELQSDPNCDAYVFFEDIYLFRDGLLLHHYLDSDGAFAYLRAQVPREARQELATVLVEERIARLDSECRTWFFLPFAVDGACRDYSWQSVATWHGREGRRGSISGNDRNAGQCSSSVTRVRSELIRLFLAAVTDPAAVEVTGTFGS